MLTILDTDNTECIFKSLFVTICPSEQICYTEVLFTEQGMTEEIFLTHQEVILVSLQGPQWPGESGD